MRNLENKARMETWSVQSPEEPGFHAVITPDKSECREEYIYRLNLPKGESYTLSSGKLELHPVLIEGAAKLSGHAVLNETMKQFDAFYIPGGDSVTITALEDCIFYIRYYYSAGCRAYAYEAHLQCYQPIIERVRPAFRDGTNLDMLIHQIFSTMLFFASRVLNGELENSEKTAGWVFEQIYSFVVPNVRQELLEVEPS